MKRLISLMAIIGLLTLAPMSMAQTASSKDSVAQVTTLADDSATAISYIDSLAADSSTIALDDMELSEDLDGEAGGVHHRLKKMFIDGTPLFMSLVALALVLGLAFCIERITYLTLSEINAKRLMKDIDAKVSQGDIEGAKQLCRDTRVLPRTDAHQREYGRHRAQHLQLWLRTDGEARKGHVVDQALYSDGAVVGILRYCHWYGDGLRADTVGRRHWSYDCGIGHEGGTHHHHLRNRSSPHPATVLQLHHLKDRASHLTDGRIGGDAARHHYEV